MGSFTFIIHYYIGRQLKTNIKNCIYHIPYGNEMKLNSYQLIELLKLEITWGIYIMFIGYWIKLVMLVVKLK